MEDPAVPEAYKRSWGPRAAIFVTVGIYFSSLIGAGLLLSLYATTQHWSRAQYTSWIEHSVVAQFAAVTLTEIIALLLLWRFLISRKAKPADIGLKKPHWLDPVYAFAGFLVYFIVYAVILSIGQSHVPALKSNQCQDLGFQVGITGNLLVLVFISLVILPPITEEILMRGFLYTGLRTKFQVVHAAVITSIIFAAAHLQIGNGQPLLWTAALDTFVLSLVLVYLRQKTDRLWSPMMVHMIKNGLAFSALFLLKTHCG